MATSPSIGYFPEAKLYSSFESSKEIKMDTLEEWRNIKPDEVGEGTWMRDKNLPTLDADQLLKCFNFETTEFKGSPPVQFTFKSAVQVVVEIINRNAKIASPGEKFPVFCPKMGGELLTILSNIETKRPDLIPEPPQYGGLVCSARSSDHQFWLGAIIQMLYEKGHISAYGRKAGEYWVSK